MPVLRPFLFPFLFGPYRGRCVSLEMLRAGWAVVYEQSGAEYGHLGKDVFVELEKNARSETVPSLLIPY